MMSCFVPGSPEVGFWPFALHVFLMQIPKWCSWSGPQGNSATNICSWCSTDECQGLGELSTQWAAFREIPNNINTDTYLFYFNFKVYYSYDIARQEWEAFLPSADLWLREIHAHRVHTNGWPGLSAVWLGFQETTVSEVTVLDPFFNFMWMFRLYRHSTFMWVAWNI